MILRNCGYCMLLAGLMLVGCEAGPPPVGPQAAHRDLSAWTEQAEHVRVIGQIDYLNVPSRWGNFMTWMLARERFSDACEVDVRACEADAKRLKGQYVLIEGALIERGPEHQPLLVAQTIRSHPKPQKRPMYAVQNPDEE